MYLPSAKYAVECAVVFSAAEASVPERLSPVEAARQLAEARCGAIAGLNALYDAGILST